MTTTFNPQEFLLWSEVKCVDPYNIYGGLLTSALTGYIPFKDRSSNQSFIGKARPLPLLFTLHDLFQHFLLFTVQMGLDSVLRELFTTTAPFMVFPRCYNGMSLCLMRRHLPFHMITLLEFRIFSPLEITFNPF